MSAFPELDDTMSGLRAALVALEQEITPAASAYGRLIEARPDLPFWTNRITDFTAFEKIGTQMYRIVARVSALYHAVRVTEGTDGEAEESVQMDALMLGMAFVERPVLQSATYPHGPDGVEDVTVLSSTVRETNPSGVGKTLAVVVTLDVPILMYVNEEF